MRRKIKTEIKNKATALKQRLSGTAKRPSDSLGLPDVTQPAAVGGVHEATSASPSSHENVPSVAGRSDLGIVETARSQQTQATLAPGATASQTHIESTTSTWAGLNILQGLLNESAGLLGPLKSAVDGIAEGIVRFEKQSKAQRDYQMLTADLDVMFEEMTKLLVAAKTPAMKKAVAEVTNDMENEMGLVTGKSQQSNISRFIEAEEYADEIENFYRKAQKLFNLLIIRVNRGMMEAQNKQLTEQKLTSLPNSLAAHYHSAQAPALRRGPCTPNTRVDVLRQLQNWSEKPDGHRIYWLNGMAGTGKTTVAYSLCQMLQSAGRLAASFFCSRQLPECRDVNKILPTIAHQLASRSFAYGDALCERLGTAPDAYNSPLENQFEQLIVSPLKSVKDEYPAGQVVVIDALDECDNKDIVDRLLVAVLAQGLALPVRFFVTSRPEAKIRDRLDSRQYDESRGAMHLHELDRLDVQKDIRTYLTAELERANVTSAHMDTLVQRSGVLFIYAATVVRYVGYDNFSRCASRLKQVLEIAKAAGYAPERDMDSLYASILEAAMRDPGAEEAEKLLIMNVLCTVICACEPLSIRSIGSLVGCMDADEVAPALRPLYSVLNVAQATEIVTTLHESFPNYMLDPKRSGGFYCDPLARHARMTHQCLDVIAAVNPPFNICKLESSYELDEEVQDLDKKIERCISDTLAYACRYWAEHLVLGRAGNLANQVNQFMQERLLLWLEVMNLKRYHSDVGTMLRKVVKWSQSAGCSADAKELIQDALRFATVFCMGSGRRSTPHIYISGLTYWPKHRPVSHQYRYRMACGISISGSGADRQEWAVLGKIKTDNMVLCVALSPNWVNVVSGSRDCALYIWDVHTGLQVVQPLRGHFGPVYSVAYSPDGRQIASGSGDHTLRIWDVHTSHHVGQLLKGHTGTVYSAIYSPDSRWVVSGSADYTVRIWDVQTNQQVGQPLRGHTGVVWSVAISPDGTYIVSGSADHTLRIWDTHTGQWKGRFLEGHTGAVHSVAYSPEGRYIVSGSADHTLRTWNAHTGEQIGEPLHGHTGVVWSVTYSADGRHVVSGSADYTLRIWDTHTGHQIGQPLEGQSGPVRSIVYSSDGAYIVSGSHDHTLYIWDAATGQQVGQPLGGHTDSVWSVAYSPTGACIVSGSGDYTVRVWDTHTGHQLQQPFDGHSRPVHSVSYSPDAIHIASGSADGTLGIWDVNTGCQVGQLLKGQTGGIRSVVYSPDGTHIVSGSSNRTVCIWDAHTGRPVGRPLRGHTGLVLSVAYSPDGIHLASGSADCTLRIWDVSTKWKMQKLLEGHTGPVYSVAYSPNGLRIVSGSADHTLRIWDTYTGQWTGQLLEGHSDIVRSAAYSPDGMRVVSGSADCTVRTWDVHTGQQVGQTLQGHVGPVYSVAYSPDGVHVVSGSEDCILRIWQLHDDSSHLRWTLDSDGWITAETHERLMWVPSELHRSLCHPCNVLLISRHGSLQLDLGNAYLGEAWTKCYQQAD